MSKAVWTLCLVAAVVLSQVAAEPPTRRPDIDTPAAEGPETRPADEPSLLDGELIEGASAPVIPPAAVDRPKPPVRTVRIREGTKIFDRLASLRKGPAGKWWTIPDARTGQLRLLPCRLLEAVETAQAKDPKSRLSLSGEVYHYRDQYYFMLRQAVVVEADAKPKSVSAPPEKTAAPEVKPPKPGADKPSPATAPGEQWASPEDVARELLGEEPGTPVVPAAQPPSRSDAGPSVTPPGKPIQAGPGGMVINRLTRLVANETAAWSLIAFESDNTLREPPMRGLPNQRLERMENWSKKGTLSGAVFRVSGEVHRYKGADYLLLRNVLRKRDLGQF